MNRVILIGHLSSDPEIRVQAGGRQVGILSVETIETWPDEHAGRPREHREKNRVVIQDQQLVEDAKKTLRKGAWVRIEGSLQTRRWVDHQNVERYSTEIALFPSMGSIAIVDEPVTTIRPPERKTRQSMNKLAVP